MTSKLPPQPPPANQKLYSQQTYNGFVLTIDGHLTYSPFTDVNPINPPPGGGGVANWVISDQNFFYNTSRGITIDRTGSFVKIYNRTTEEPLALAIILDANFAANTIQILVIKYEFGKNVADINPGTTLLKLRLEDNWKFCSNIPDWIPAGAESLNRWIPIMSNELEPSLGQKLNLKGGVASVDGLSIPLVLDTSYQDNNRLQRLFTEDAATYQYTNTSLGQIDVDNVIENNVAVQTTLIAVGSFGFPATSVPDYAGQYAANYPFLNPSGTELALPEPWFIDTEAIIATTRIGGIVPPPPAVPTFQYGVQRAIDDTPATTHGKYTIIFNGMPFAIGQTCKLWEINNFNNKGFQDWIVSYRGMIENIAFSEGLASCTVEISSIAFTARVNAGFSTQATALERRLVPRRRTPDEDLVFYHTFIASQPALQDTFFWVKIGAICLPIRRLASLNYQAALGNEIVQEELQTLYGLQTSEIRGRFERDISSGTTDVGYRIGLEDAFGDFWDVGRLFEPDPITYGLVYNMRIRNWFNPESSLLDTDPIFLPQNSPWGFYILDQLPDEKQHNIYTQARSSNSLESTSRFRREDRQSICDYLSSEKPVLVHLFQNFSKGYVAANLPGYAQSFRYTGDSSVTSTDRRNFYMETSIVDVILQVLTSTGSGTTDVDLATTSYRQVPGINGVWDLIPREFALGIPLEEIDLDSFNRIVNKRGGMNETLVTNIYMEAGKDTPQKFLEEQILKPFFLALATNSMGKVILVDVADTNVGPDTVAISADSFVRKNGQKTRVNLTYDAVDLSDSFTYTWKEPFRTYWIDPRFNRVSTSSGVSGGEQFRQISTGERVSIKSKARLFQRIQASPIKYELRYAPINGGEETGYEGDKINIQALKYLSRFNRIIPRAKFELFWDYDQSFEIGDVVTFNLDAIPNKDGIIGDNTKTIVGKIIDVKVDRKAKTAEYTAVLTDTTLAPLDIVWNLTTELVSPASTFVWNITSQQFCVGYNTLRDTAGEIIWEFDYSQFLVGDVILIWDQNWRFVGSTTITDIPGVNQIEVASTGGFVAGYRITLETLANSTSAYAPFQTWFGEGQKYLF